MLYPQKHIFAINISNCHITLKIPYYVHYVWTVYIAKTSYTAFKKIKIKLDHIFTYSPQLIKICTKKIKSSENIYFSCMCEWVWGGGVISSVVNQ